MNTTTIIWRVAALLCLGAGCYQGYEVAGKIQHLTTMAWKLGVEPGLISAGREMIVIFFVVTAVFLGLGLVATDKPLKLKSWFRFASMLDSEILIAGAMIWAAMVASPYVQIVSR
jgi:hypothetical protein